MIRDTIALLNLCIQRAKTAFPDSAIRIMIGSEKPDGSGMILVRFNGEKFIEEVSHLVGYEQPTKEDLDRFDKLNETEGWTFKL